MLAEYELAPWGEVAQDLRDQTVAMGIAKAALHNPVSGEDFAVKFDDEPQTPDQMRAILRAAAQKASE